MNKISLNISKGKLISIGRLKLLIGLSPKNKKQISNDKMCVCEENAMGNAISGWCVIHKTEWI